MNPRSTTKVNYGINIHILRTIYDLFNLDQNYHPNCYNSKPKARTCMTRDNEIESCNVDLVHSFSKSSVYFHRKEFRRISLLDLNIK